MNVASNRSLQSANELPDNDPDGTELICGETIDHDIDHSECCEEDGRTYWHCRRCDAEGFEEAE